jgi:hypothetical protein
MSLRPVVAPRSRLDLVLAAGVVETGVSRNGVEKQVNINKDARQQAMKRQNAERRKEHVYKKRQIPNQDVDDANDDGIHYVPEEADDANDDGIHYVPEGQEEVDEMARMMRYDPDAMDLWGLPGAAADVPPAGAEQLNQQERAF